MHDHQINEHVPICINYQTSTFEIKQVMIKTGGDVEMKGCGIYSWKYAVVKRDNISKNGGDHQKK